MLDIAVQLMQKWERLNPDDTVDVPADMTRLTLDTIALCGFDYRFNSFYRDTPHPFVVAMLGALEAAQAQARELPIQRKLNRKRAARVPADQELMVETVQHIIEERRASGATGHRQRPARPDADRRRSPVRREARRRPTSSPSASPS